MPEEADSTKQTRMFVVSLSVFGWIFSAGVGAFLAGSRLWGLTWILASIIGAAVLVRDRIRSLPIRIFLLVLASWVGALIIGYTSYQITEVSKAMNIYVLPRTVNNEQAEAIVAYLAPHEAFKVTIKVNARDGEATEYGGHLLNALKRTSWEIKQNDSPENPQILMDGLCIHETGSSHKPKSDPAVLLKNALHKAQVTVNCGPGGPLDGEYELFLLVGHRPVAIGEREPWKNFVRELIMKLTD